MYFRSEAQRQKFRDLVAAGRISQDVYDRWEARTPKDAPLPDRLHPKVLAQAAGDANPGARSSTGLDPKLEAQGRFLSLDQFAAADLPMDAGGPYTVKGGALYSVKGAGLFDTDHIDPRPDESLAWTRHHPRVGGGKVGPEGVSAMFDDLRMADTGTLGDAAAATATKLGRAAALRRFGLA